MTGGPTKILDIITNERLVTDWLDWRGDNTAVDTTGLAARERGHEDAADACARRLLTHRRHE